MLEIIPYIFPILLNVVVGLVMFLFYQDSRQSGLELLSIAFFLNIIPDIIYLVLGGPYLILRLMDQGFTVSEVGVFTRNLSLFGSAFNILFAVLILVGAYKLARKNKVI